MLKLSVRVSSLLKDRAFGPEPRFLDVGYDMYMIRVLFHVRHAIAYGQTELLGRARLATVASQAYTVGEDRRNTASRCSRRVARLRLVSISNPKRIINV